MRFLSYLAVTRLLVFSCIGLITMISVFAQQSDGDPIRSKLENAKVTFERALEKNRKDVIGEIDKRVTAAGKKGDRKGKEAALSERQTFVESDQMPKATPIAIKDRYEKAVKELGDAFIAAGKLYTKAGKDDESALVDKEKDVFRNRYSRTPQDAVRFRGKSYKVFNDKSTWHQAKAKCEQMGGRLAVVDNPAVNDFLVTELEKSNLADAFLGATDEAREGEWLWVTNTKLSFNNWGVWDLKNQKNREPNNFTGNEHYLLLVAVMKDRPEWRGKWADVPDSPGAAFICQWD